MTLGITLVVIGAIFLLKNLGVLGSVNWEIIWPIALIALGALLWKQGERRIVM